MSSALHFDQPESPHSFLNEVYQSLDYQRGTLLDAVNGPNNETNQEWLEKGDWLVLAKRAGAEKVFFVNNDPVLVFCRFQDIPDDRSLLIQFRRVWCMARPQFLFIALPGELRVYRLDQPPTMNIEILREDRQIATVEKVSEVAEKLRAFRRERIELGYLTTNWRFGGIDQRADRRLIQDLKNLRRLLLKTGLNPKYAHALIGRSIFICYLEDRQVLTSKYFEEVAYGNSEWMCYLSEDLEKPDLQTSVANRWYIRVLKSKEFTYALFNRLAIDFNGDMFPQDPDEEQEVDQEKHLNPLCKFLLGDTNPDQPSLFFWAYDFEIIPIELISSIYEEFYHKSSGDEEKDDKGTHYTPSVLVEYILSSILTEECLSTRPKILDPACGSGIFLVEAFRRIVRYELAKHPEHKLSSDDLRKVLREQIRGIEINEEAVSIAAFSLYLALLHYQEPPDIRAKRLPNLIDREGYQTDDNHYNILFKKNTFALTDIEREKLRERLNAKKRYSGRIEDELLLSSVSVLPPSLYSLDVIVGNPPWGFEKGMTQDIRDEQSQIKRWCERFGWSIGDNELSQAFIARSLSLLKPGGLCGLLISTGVFFKHHENSKKFRWRWLSEATIKTIVNLVHVRHAFFNADAPFAFVHFEANPPSSEHWVDYWSVKKTEIIDKTQAIVLGQPDIRIVKQLDLQHNDFLWKVYWWGNHRDATLIRTLRLNTTLAELAKVRKWPKPGRGFEKDFPTGSHNPSSWLQNYKALPTEHFTRYGEINLSDLEPVPDMVHRYGDPYLQNGWRLLIKRGIDQANASYGRIEARLENKSYCFQNSIHGLNVSDAEDWERKILIGIIWSSLARYYYFMTASSWGTWHYEIHLEEAMSLPVRFPKDKKTQKDIIEVIDTLLEYDAYKDANNESLNTIFQLEKQLDQAIFDLYRLNEAERDLILDMCEVNLEFFYKHNKSNAIKSVERFPRQSQGHIIDVSGDRKWEKGLEGYIHVFLEVWNSEMEPEGEFCWRVIRPSLSPMIAVIFSTQEKGDLLPKINFTDEEDWVNILEKCSQILGQPVSQRIYIDGMIRVVSDTDIYIIKRDERRLWTRSMAREDAEATLLQAMDLQEAVRT